MEKIILEDYHNQPLDININKITEQVRTCGVCVIKNFTNKINIINEEFEKIINDKTINFDKNTGKNKCLRTNLNGNYLNKITFPLIVNLFNLKIIKDVCKSFNINFNTDQKDVFIHKDYECNNTNNVYPHFDNDRKLKFYLCVNDMDTTNGCFKVLPNKLDMVNEIRKNRNKRNNIFNKNHKLYTGTQHIEINELTPLEAKAGDLIIFDTNCIHAGGDKFEDGKLRKVIRLHLSM
jgi:hypothetical protein